MLLHFLTPSDPITPSQVWWSVPTLALKSPRRMSLSVRGAAEITESRSLYSKAGVYRGIHYFSHFLLEDINCEYSFEPPWQGGSNEYPQSMF